MVNIFSDNIYCFNEKFKENILTSISSNSINSFIISGPKGIGKVKFVNNLSKYLLCELESDNSINISSLKVAKYSFDNIKKNKSFHLFNNQSHPDFFYLKNDKDNEGKKIPIEDIRNLKTFFQKTCSISKTKIAVIDTIEDLTINSLNSLLKTIEELPEKSYVFIISNKPINIIETIKSRCAVFHLKPLNKSEFNKFTEKNFNNISFEEKIFLSNVCKGSPGLAVEIVTNKIYDIYNDLLENFIVSQSIATLTEKLLNLFSSKSKNNELIFLTFHLIINDLFIKSFFLLNEKKIPEYTLNKEKKIIEIILNNNNPLKLLKLHSKFDKNMHSASLLNLNKSEIIIDTFKDLIGR